MNVGQPCTKVHFQCRLCLQRKDSTCTLFSSHLAWLMTRYKRAKTRQAWWPSPLTAWQSSTARSSALTNSSRTTTRPTRYVGGRALRSLLHIMIIILSSRWVQDTLSPLECASGLGLYQSFPRGAWLAHSEISGDSQSQMKCFTLWWHRQVYNPQTMEDEIMMVSGMPLRIGKKGWLWIILQCS